MNAGCAEAGKSTFLKQLIQIYGKGFPQSERRTYTPVVFSNIIKAAQTLLQECPSYGVLEPRNEAAVKHVQELQGDEDIDEKLGSMLAALWNDPSIQKTFDYRSRFQLS